VAAGYSEMFGDAGRFEIDYRIIRDGDEGQQECWLRAHGRRDPDRPGGYIGTVQDVTDLRAAELDAMRQRDYAQAIINSTHEGFLLTRDGEILDVNPALCELTGFSRETLLGARAPYPFWAPETAAQIERHRRKVSAAGSGAVETTFARADGTRVEVAMTTLQGGSGPNGQPAYVTTVRDISAEKRNRAELQVLATRDALTGLLNQRVFHEQLRDEIARAERHGRPLSIAIFDLDHFKAINDRHGHPTGDAVLRDVARRLQSLVRDGEHLARIGGEEFARILPDATGIGAFAAAERTRRAISAEPFPGVGTLTLSAGVCELAEAGSLERLYEYADRALYAAKQQGRDRTIRYAVQTAADYDRSCIGT
jgi:diguanylate cyclase (GGDEF)-like protein/PAS domain S-box-containing protein